jgi:hypothetical protein
MIYIASPFSDPSPTVRVSRRNAAHDAVVRLTDARHVVFSPVVISGELVIYTIITFDSAWWYEWSMDFLRAATEVWVLCIDGWKTSKGVQDEIAEALRLGKPVKYLDPDTLELTEAAP